MRRPTGHGVSAIGGALPALDRPLEEVHGATFARVPDVLPAAWRDALLAEIREHRFGPVVEEVGPVRQQVEELVVPLDALRYPVTVRLAEALRQAVSHCAARFPGLARFVPNEAVYLRYRGPAAGISPHRDHRRYVVLIAVFTLQGEAPFSIVADRAGKHVLASWNAAAGDLVLLRAPGLVGDDDRRPLHTVGSSTGHERLSLTLRMDFPMSKLTGARPR